MSPTRDELTELLRRRLLAGLRDGTLAYGSRLASTRAVASQLGVDPRLAMASYRELAREGMVELRQRSGIYVAARTDTDGAPVPPREWLVDLLGAAIERDVAAADLARWLQLALETLRLRAVVIAATADQTVGICAELRGNYGLEAYGIVLSAKAVSYEAGASSTAAIWASGAGTSRPPEASRLQCLPGDGERLPPSLARADLVVTTPASEALARPLATRLGVPLILADVRPDLLGAEWRQLLLEPVSVVVADELFGQMVRTFLSGTPGAERLTVLVAGRDDISGIPDDAPVYVTRAAQQVLGDGSLPGRRVPPARVFTAEASRAILHWMVAANLAADNAQRATAAAMTQPPAEQTSGPRSEPRRVEAR